MPSIPAARREQAPPPPAARNRWDCPLDPTHHGYAQNAHAAYVAGTRHFLDFHDQPSTPGQETHR